MLEFHCKTFHKLSVEELYEMLALRQEVFVIEQNCPYLDADGKDQKSWHLWACDDARKLVAYCRLMPQGMVYENYPAIGRVVTSPSCRGTGIGRQLVQAALEWTAKLFGGQPVKLSAQSYLIRFYESFGFQTVGEEYLEDGIPHTAMILRPRQEV